MTSPLDQPDAYPDDQPPAEANITHYASTEDEDPEALMGQEVTS